MAVPARRPIGAPFFYKPLAYLFNKSLATSTVPRQWENASILPVPKIPSPLNHADFRPISITPVLCRTLERIVVREFCVPCYSRPTRTVVICRTIRLASVLQGPPLLHLLLYYRQSQISWQLTHLLLLLHFIFPRPLTLLGVMPHLARWPC